MHTELIHFETQELHAIPDATHGWMLTTAEVAAGYGVSPTTIRQTKSRHADELMEGKHWAVTICHTPGGPQEMTLWTQKGIVRLGFFIRSAKAARFRDWAEDLVLGELTARRHLEGQNPVEQLSVVIREFAQAVREFRGVAAELTPLMRRADRRRPGLRNPQGLDGRVLPVPECYRRRFAARQEVLDYLQGMISAGKRQEQAIRDFLVRARSGSLPARILLALAEANAHSGGVGGRMISRRSLMRWKTEMATARLLN